MGPRHVPAQHLARAAYARSPTQARAIMATYPGGRVDRRRRSAGPTTAPTRRLLQRRVSSSRCGRRRTGRSWSSETGWQRWLFGAERRAHQGRAGRRDERRAGRASCPASTGTSRRTSATTSWRRSPASRATTRSRSSAPTSTSWKRWPTRSRTVLQAGPRHRERRHLQHQGAVATWSSASIREKCQHWGVQRRRRQQRRRRRRWAARRSRR